MGTAEGLGEGAGLLGEGAGLAVGDGLGVGVRFSVGLAIGVLAAVLRGRAPADAAEILTQAQKAFSASPPFSDYQGGAGRFAARRLPARSGLAPLRPD